MQQNRASEQENALEKAARAHAAARFALPKPICLGSGHDGSAGAELILKPAPTSFKSPLRRQQRGYMSCLSPSKSPIAQADTSARRTRPFLIAKADPNRWVGTLYEHLGLTPRVIPAPLPGSPDSSKALGISTVWNSAHAKLAEAAPDDALKIAQKVNDLLFDRHRHFQKFSLVHLQYDRFDPGTKLIKSVELASYALFDRAADGTFPNVTLIEQLSADMIAFHTEHFTVNDMRFAPLRAMGRCLQTLARILRDAE